MSSAPVPTRPDASPEALVERSRAAQARGETEVAAALVRQALAQAPTHRGALLAAIDVALEAGDTAGALGAAETAMPVLGAEDPGLALRRARALRDSGRPDLARALLAPLVAASSDPGLGAALGQALQDLGRAAEADAAFSSLGAHPAVAFGRIEAALALGRPEAALRLAETAPASPGLASLAARALQALGRHEEARARLVAALRRSPGLPWLRAALARVHLDTGRIGAARALHARLAARRPHNPAVLHLGITLAESAGAPTLALERAEAAVAARPNDASLALRRIEALRRLHRPADALAALEAAAARFPALPQLRAARAEALLEAGETDRAAALAAALRAEVPFDRAAVLIDTAARLAQGSGAEAVADLAASLAARPGDRPLRHRLAWILREQGRAEDSLAVLRAAPGDDDPWLGLARARALADMGQLAAMAAEIDAILLRRPGHRDARRLRMELRLARGAAPEVLAEALAAPPDPAEDAALLLPALEAAAADLPAAETAAILRRLWRAAPLLTDDALWRACRLAESVDPAGAAADWLSALIARGPSALGPALDLLRQIRGVTDDATFAAAAAALEARVPPGRRAALAVEARLLAEGPEAALAEARRRCGPRRDLSGARLVGRIVTLAGRPLLAERYLGRALRDWPADPVLLDLLTGARLAAGRADIALAEAERLAATIPGHRRTLDRIRLRALAEMGRLDEALALAEALAPEDRAAGNTEFRMRLHIALGNLPEAERLAARLRQQEIARPHLGPSLSGLLLTELRLWRAAEAEGPAPEDRYTLAAQARLAAWCAAAPSPAAVRDARVPVRVLQYWDRPEPPEGIEAAMATWREVFGRDWLRLDRAGALHFLRERFGPDMARAFRLANNPAEGSDLLRLAWLAAEGGIYADADDRLIGDAAGIVAGGAGLMVFREPFGALANNVIAARPEHPAILRALGMAREALLRRDNDSTWAKTGPGLLTRAVAGHLVAAGAADADISVRPEAALRRIVRVHLDLPYKSAGRHWNSQAAARPALVAAANALASRR